MSLHLGLDLGGTNIKATVLEVGADGEPTQTQTSSLPTEAHLGPEHVTVRLIESGAALVDLVGPVDSVGIGVPGLFDADNGTISLFPNLPGPWEGHRLRDPIASALGADATLINDARAFVLAEGTLGAGRGHDILIGITLGTGIGGIMMHGRIELGTFGTGGEIGHQIVLPDGPPCGCGNKGCVEPLAMASTLTELAGHSDVAEIYRLSAAGDQECREAVETVANYLGIGLANVVTLLGPSCVVIGGGISDGGELVLEPIRAALRRHVTLAPVDRVQIVQAELGSWAGAIGAALAGKAQLDVLAT